MYGMGPLATSLSPYHDVLTIKVGALATDLAPMTKPAPAEYRITNWKTTTPP